jgi:hypothetical protein
MKKSKQDMFYDIKSCAISQRIGLRHTTCWPVQGLSKKHQIFPDPFSEQNQGKKGNGSGHLAALNPAAFARGHLANIDGNTRKINRKYIAEGKFTVDLQKIFINAAVVATLVRLPLPANEMRAGTHPTCFPLGGAFIPIFTAGLVIRRDR